MGSPPPHLAVYWVDTMEPLTYRERRDIIGSTLVSVTPHEVLIEVKNGKTRKVAVVSIADPKGLAILKRHKIL